MPSSMMERPGQGSIEQREASLRGAIGDTAKAERTRAIFALPVREQVAFGVQFDERAAMPARPPASCAD